MSRRITVTALLVVGLAVVATLVATLVAWLPWNPFEGSVPRVADLLPDRLRLIVRIDAAQAARSPLVERLWEHAAVRQVRQRFDLDRTVLEPVRRIEERLADASLGLGAAPTVRRDLFGREVVVALRDQDVLVLTRISARGRAIEGALVAVRGLEPEERERLGLRVDGDLLLVEAEGRPPLALARYRDVLAISTSRALVDEVLGRSRGGRPQTPGARALTAATGATRATHEGEAVASFWVDPDGRPDGLDGPAKPASDASAEDFWRAVFDASRLRPLTGTVRLRGEDGVSVRVDGAYRDVPRVLRQLGTGGVGRADAGVGTSDPGARAARFAVPGEALVVCGVHVPAARAIEMFVDAQPPSRRDLVTELLAEAGDTPATVGARLARTLEGGVGAVVARLPDADDLDLDTPAGGGVDPIPATVLVFALRDAASGEDFLADLARECDTLFGSPLRAEPERIRDARLHTLEKNLFGGNLLLLRPAFALVDGLVIFSTNDGYLRRALEHSAEGGPRPSGAYEDAVARATVVGGPLRAYVDDQRWEHAERASFHDWRREREQIRREMDLAPTARTPRQRAEFEERRILERVQRRDEVEFPRALDEYRRAWLPLGIVSEVRLSATLAGTKFHLDAELDVELDVELGGATAPASAVEPTPPR